MSLSRVALLFLVLARVASAESAEDAWRVPPPGACATERPRLLVPPATKDASPIRLPAPGEAIDFAHAERLREVMPPEIWEKR